MKTIMLLRHAKSSHDDSSLKDFERPLAKQGQRDAPRMAKFVREVKALPATIISSPAKRAKQTTELFVKQAGIAESVITWDEELYYGGTRNYLSAVQHAPENVSDIMLVGHNPLMEETVSLLCIDEDTSAVRMPAAALVCIEHPAIEWEQVKPGTARIQCPRLLNKLG